MKTKHLLGALLSFLCTIIFFSCGNNNEEKIYPLSFEKEYYEQPLLRATDITIRGGNRDYTVTVEETDILSIDVDLSSSIGMGSLKVQQILHSPRLFCHHGLQRIHSIGIPVGQETLYKEHDNGQPNNDAADSCRKAVIPSDFSHELIVNEHRKCFIAFTDKHGCTEISKYPHKDQHGAGKEGRHNQGNDNPANPASLSTAKTFRRFIQ